MRIVYNANHRAVKVVMTELEYRRTLDENTGVCLGCQQEQGDVEPDARKYRCHNTECQSMRVYGFEVLMAAGMIDFTEGK